MQKIILIMAVKYLIYACTTFAHVLKTIKKLKPKSSCDAQGVSTKMIKFIGNEISIPLAHIFNLSLSTGTFPSELKLCRDIPIFKSGSAFECDNYRPISLLSSISSEKLISHLLDNDLLYTHPYGFLPQKSTEHSLNANFIIRFESSCIAPA